MGGLDSTRLDALDAYLHEYVQPAQGVRQLAGTTVAVARDGKLVHFKADGDQVLGEIPMSQDTIFRFYSMTKPVTAVTLMTFWEQAKFHLDDPVSQYLPAFTDMRVLRTPSSSIDDTVPAERPITVRHLLTHTSGLSYGFDDTNAVNRYYHSSGLPTPPGMFNLTLADWVKQLAEVPLLFQPGTHWHYSLGLDVCGALVEALAGESFQVVVQKRVLDPLGMVDTGFMVPEEKRGRFTPNYSPPTAEQPIADVNDTTCTMPVLGASGGGGLCGTTSDYLRFAMMLVNYGEFDGARILAPRTVRLLAANNVEGGKDLKTLGTFPGDIWSTHGSFTGALQSVEHWEGIGQALGGQVVLDPVQSDMATGKGMYFWGGAAGTLVNIDFGERLVYVYMQQRQDGGPSIIGADFRTLVQAAIYGDAGLATHWEV